MPPKKCPLLESGICIEGYCDFYDEETDSCRFWRELIEFLRKLPKE